MAVDHCACRDKHCTHKNEDSAAAKIHTNRLLDKAFHKMQCPSFEHQLCERDVNCGFDHDVASNQRFGRNWSRGLPLNDDIKCELPRDEAGFRVRFLCNSEMPFHNGF